jgi:hypothetical protein
MSPTVPRLCWELAQMQDGVISRKQALDGGMSADGIENLMRTGRWQTLHRGVYSIFTGPPTRRAALWAAVHRAGSNAALSHQTAAELFKLTDQRSPSIHVTISDRRRISPVAGVVVHHSNRLDYAVHPSLEPPRTRIEETVLDLVDDADTFDEAFGLACAGCQRRLTTASRLAEAMTRRTKIRWRNELRDALGAIDVGVHSVLEYRYQRRVERPHGLPAATRQARVVHAGRSRYLDNLYGEYGLCVELDGLSAHPDDQRWRDLSRVNAITERGVTILRYGWVDVDRRACQIAAQIGAVLRNLGWPGPVKSCRPACPAGSQTSHDPEEFSVDVDFSGVSAANPTATEKPPSKAPLKAALTAESDP